MDLKKQKVSESMQEDGISSLPECLLLGISSFLPIINAVQTTCLSKEWKDLWRSLGHIDLIQPRNFSNRKYDKFVRKFLAKRDKSIHIYDLKFIRNGWNQSILRRVIRSALTHKVQNLSIMHTFLRYSKTYLLPLQNSLFTCQSLRTLVLINCFVDKLPKFWALPMLTTLKLQRVRFVTKMEKSINLLSNCPCLENLSLVDCLFSVSINPYPKIGTPQLALGIVAPRLISLTIGFDGDYYQRAGGFKIVVSAPNLSYFEIKRCICFSLSMNGSNSLDKVIIDCQTVTKITRQVPFLMKMLPELCNARSIQLPMDLIMAMESVLLEHQPSPFRNLESLKLKSSIHCTSFEVPDNVRMYLLGSSPSAKIIFPDESEQD